jgi:hypothetical protein
MNLLVTVADCFDLIVRTSTSLILALLTNLSPPPLLTCTVHKGSHLGLEKKTCFYQASISELYDKVQESSGIKITFSLVIICQYAMLST